MKIVYYACFEKSSFLFQGLYELSKINQDTLKGHEATVGADLSCAPPIYRPNANPTTYPDHFVNLHKSPVFIHYPLDILNILSYNLTR